MEKTCLKCKGIKNLDDFHKRKKGKCGIAAICKDCSNKKLREYRALNSQKVKDWQKKRNSKITRDPNTYIKYRLRNLTYARIYREKNKDLVNSKNKNWVKDNPEKYKSSYTKYRLNNREKINKKHKDWNDNLSDSNIIHRLKQQGFPDELIYQKEIIQIKRVIIKTKRLCKTSQS